MVEDKDNGGGMDGDGALADRVDVLNSAKARLGEEAFLAARIPEEIWHQRQHEWELQLAKEASMRDEWALYCCCGEGQNCYGAV